MDTFESMTVAAETLMMLRNSILTFSKQSQGTDLKPHCTRTDVRDILMRRCRQMFNLTDKMNQAVTMSFTVSDNVAQYILTDENWVWEMINNLLSNARYESPFTYMCYILGSKFTGDGSISTNVYLVQTETDKPLIQFEVIDTGKIKKYIQFTNGNCRDWSP